MKRALVVALVLALIAGLLAAPVEAKKKRTKPAATREDAGPEDVSCPWPARRVNVGDNAQARINSAGRGASLCFKAGTYRLHRPLRPRAGQKLTFEPGALLSGAKLARGWKKEGSHWVLGGQRQSFDVPSWMREHMCDNNPRPCIYEDVYMDDKPLKHVTSLNKLRAGRVYFDRGADKIYIATNPGGHTMEATVATTAIASGAAGVTIRGATIEKFADAGIIVSGANNWTISDSVIRHVHFQGIGVYGGTGHVIQDTLVHRNGVIGMSASDVDNFTIGGNEFAHNNYLHAGPVFGGYHEGSVKILKSRDVVFRDNWSHHNDGDGLWFDYDNRDILIENNLLERNTRHGFQYEASFDATVRYNTIRNNGTLKDRLGAGILNSTSKNVDYLENRIVNNVLRSIVITWQDRGRHDRFGERQSANLLFRDNVIVLHNNFQSWVGVYWDQDPGVYSSNNRFEGNTYIVPKDGEREGDHWWLWKEKGLTWARWRAYGFDDDGSFLRREAGQKNHRKRNRDGTQGNKQDGNKQDGNKQDGRKQDGNKQGERKQGDKKQQPKERKTKKPAPQPVTSQRQLFLRDPDGCDSNENSLSLKNGPDKGCRDINQNPAQVWLAVDGARFKLDASRPITGKVTTAGGQCVPDGGCSTAGLGVGMAELDVVVSGAIRGKRKQLGMQTEAFAIAPTGTHTSQLSIKLDPTLLESKVNGLKVVTRLHGAAVGHSVVVLDPASFIRVPTLPRDNPSSSHRHQEKKAVARPTFPSAAPEGIWNLLCSGNLLIRSIVCGREQ